MLVSVSIDLPFSFLLNMDHHLSLKPWWRYWNTDASIWNFNFSLQWKLQNYQKLGLFLHYHPNTDGKFRSKKQTEIISFKSPQTVLIVLEREIYSSYPVYYVIFVRELLLVSSVFWNPFKICRYMDEKQGNPVSFVLYDRGDVKKIV